MIAPTLPTLEETLEADESTRLIAKNRPLADGKPKLRHAKEASDRSACDGQCKLSHYATPG